MGSSFTLHADFNQLDGGVTLTKSVSISSNVQVIGDGGIIYDNTTVALVDGVLQVELPANDNDPGDFGYTVRRATGLTKTWRVPVQAPGVTVELTTFTATTPLPLPPSGNAVSQTDFIAYQAEAAAALADAIEALVDGAPGALDTLHEIATQLATDESAASAILATLSGHVADHANPHAVTKAQVGLSNVDNTSDANKPVSTAQATAITTAINNLVNGAPGALDTLNEIATQLGSDESAATALLNAVAALRGLTDSTFATNLSASTGPIVSRPKPAASGTAQSLLQFNEYTGDAPLDFVTNEFNNSGSGHGKNGSLHIGWGAALHGDSAGARAAAADGHASIFLGMENRYYDPVDDLSEGVEFYIDTAPKNQKASSRSPAVLFDIASRRPFYTRGLFMDDDGDTFAFRTRFDIGNSGDANKSSFAVFADVASGAPLFALNSAQMLVQVPTLALIGNLVQVSPATGDAQVLVKAASAHSSSMLFQIGTAAKMQLIEDGGSFYVYDAVNSRVHTNFQRGASVAASLLSVNAALAANGLITALAGIQASPATGTADVTVKAPGGTNAADKTATITFWAGGASAGASTTRWRLITDNGSQYLYDYVNSAVHANHVPGASDVAAYSEFRTVKVKGTLVGSGATAPTAAATGNLGTSPPAPVVVAGSNYIRGTVQIGSGSGTQSIGGVATLTIPAGVFAAAPKVFLTGKNLATVQRSLYCSVSNTTTVQIAFGVASTASQAVGTYEVDYLLIG